MNNLGLYYPGNSFWHGVDPRTKLLVIIFLMVMSWVIHGPGWIVLIGGMGLIIWSSRLPLSQPVQLLWKFKWLLLITFAANLVTPGLSPNFQLTLNHNLYPALTIVARLSLMLVIASWLSWVTRPISLIDGISRLLKPLIIFKVPVMDISLMMTLVLRFIPELLADSEDIVTAQRARGVKPQLTWRNSRIWLQSTLIPLFILSIRKSVAMAVAMESRGFRPGLPRTSMEELKFRIGDYLIFLGIGLAVGIMVLGNR